MDKEEKRGQYLLSIDICGRHRWRSRESRALSILLMAMPELKKNFSHARLGGGRDARAGGKELLDYPIGAMAHRQYTMQHATAPSYDF